MIRPGWDNRWPKLGFDHPKQSVSVREIVATYHTNATLPPDRAIWHPIPQLHKGMPIALHTNSGCGLRMGCQNTRFGGRVALVLCVATFSRTETDCLGWSIPNFGQHDCPTGWIPVWSKKDSLIYQREYLSNHIHFFVSHVLCMKMLSLSYSKYSALTGNYLNCFSVCH